MKIELGDAGRTLLAEKELAGSFSSSDQTSVLSFLSGGSSDEDRCAPQSVEAFGTSKAVEGRKTSRFEGNRGGVEPKG